MVRVPPPSFDGPWWREAPRRVLLGGAAIARGSADQWAATPLAAVLDQSGALPIAADDLDIRISRSGSLLVRARCEGHRAVVRIAVAATAAAESQEAAAATLRRLPPHPALPRVLGAGTAGELAWSAETELPGRRPARLSPGLAGEVAALLSLLPKAAGPARAHLDDLDAIAQLLPDRRDALKEVGVAIDGGAGPASAVGRHGDLWHGNLLVDRHGRLTGIVDWDAWHPAAVPGTDLVHLFATALRYRERVELGALLTSGRWWGPEVEDWCEAYWHAVGGPPVGEARRALGWAWWASEVAGTLRRTPERAADDRWLAANVEAALAPLGG